MLLAVLAQSKWKERPLHCSFFGEGNAAASVRRLAARLGASNVSFEGQTGSIEAIWRRHQILILPSRYEGLPLVIVEAMLSGRPCIVTDVAGNTEMVQDGVTGFVAAAPTERHLDETLERAWIQRDRWEAMGRAAFQHACESVPPDPAAAFAGTLLAEMENRPAASALRRPSQPNALERRPDHAHSHRQ